MSDATEPRSARWRALPGWARIGILVGATVLVVLAVAVAVRVATRVPPIPLGTTAVADLRPGACLAEPARDAAQYTVVPCSTAHPQQVFAVADLAINDSIYELVEPALATFGDQVCSRFREYRLGLQEGLVTGDYVAYAIDVPDRTAWEAGDTVALCAIADVDGASLSADLYRPVP